MNWRVITTSGTVVSISGGKGAALAFAQTKEMTFLVDRTNKTIVCVQDKDRIAILQFTENLREPKQPIGV